MPRGALRPCTYPGCDVLVISGRCKEHSPSNVRRDPEVKRLYNSRRWQSMRAVQLGINPWCAVCLERGDHVPATEVDHIQPHKGDPILFFDPNNLQSLCKTDHAQKTWRELGITPSKKDSTA